MTTTQPSPQKLPFCEYPKAADVESHGLQPLPAMLPLIDLDKGLAYRSSTYKAVSAAALSPAQISELTRVIGHSFSLNEPMTRHVKPPKHAPPGLHLLKHRDPLGDEAFGEWTKANIMFWVFRLYIVTDPASPLENIALSQDVVDQSLAIQDNRGRIIGGAININLAVPGSGGPIRTNDPFMDAVGLFSWQIYQFISTQLNLSLTALSETYPDFRTALEQRKVADLNLVARSTGLPTGDTFELVAASFERFMELGHCYVVISAANQWTGAACEVLGGVRVHFKPYRFAKVLPGSPEAADDMATSADGFISGKDSGCMVYVFRLR